MGVTSIPHLDLFGVMCEHIVGFLVTDQLNAQILVL